MSEEHRQELVGESSTEKTSEKIHGGGTSSTSSSDIEDEKTSSPLSENSKVYRLSGREKPVHKVFGSEKPADIFMWRNKKLSAGVLGGTTVAWILFELLEYHLVTLLCYFLILSLSVLFLWSNVGMFIYKSTPKIPEVHIPEDPILQLASALRVEINRGLATLWDISFGKDFKKFLSVITGLGFLSMVGSCCDFLTLLYTAVLLIFTLPLLYERYEARIDAFVEKAIAVIKKQYSVLDAKFLSKIPRGPLTRKRD